MVSVTSDKEYCFNSEKMHGGNLSNNSSNAINYKTKIGLSHSFTSCESCAKDHIDSYEKTTIDGNLSAIL